MDEAPAERVVETLAAFVPRLARNIVVALDEHPSLQLSLRQLRILERLAERPHRITELAVQSMVSQPTATLAIAALAARGAVSRRSDPGDRRAILVELTSEGTALLAESRERIRARLRAIVGDVSEVEADVIERLGRHLLDGMDRAHQDRASRQS